MTNENLRRAMEEQKKVFVAKFGREPGPSDPIFFDPDMPDPVPMSEAKMTAMMMSAMEKAGTAGHLIYAFEKTGLMLTEQTYKTASRQVRRQWDRAVNEWFERQGMN
jgi:hypothetical protein